jgi:hypothetical protein
METRTTTCRECMPAPCVCVFAGSPEESGALQAERMEGCSSGGEVVECDPDRWRRRKIGSHGRVRGADGSAGCRRAGLLPQSGSGRRKDARHTVPSATGREPVFGLVAGSIRARIGGGPRGRGVGRVRRTRGMSGNVIDPGDQAACRDHLRRNREHQPERDRPARSADHRPASGSLVDPGRIAANSMAPTGPRSP